MHVEVLGPMPGTRYSMDGSGYQLLLTALCCKPYFFVRL